MPRPVRLYLDAARLGGMSPTAQRAARDFARLAGEGLSTLYWEQFFRGGFLPHGRAGSLPILARWRGVPGLRRLVRDALAAPPETPVLFASRATALLQRAVQFAAANCRRILTTDTLWPAYAALLKSQCDRCGAAVEVVAVRDQVLSGKSARHELLNKLVREFSTRRCDGLVVSSVSHDGVRLPLSPLIPALRAVIPRAVIVVDGAQELAHVPVNLSLADCDIFITGCHKWLGASQPLGIALLSNVRTADRIREEMRAADDPLLDYLNCLDGIPAIRFPETVNLAPLLTAWGACVDFRRRLRFQNNAFRQQVQQASRLIEEAPRLGWSPMGVSPALRTAIVLLRCQTRVWRETPSNELQARFAAAGLFLTAYHDGVVRVSMPQRSLPPDAWDLLRAALAVSARTPLRHHDAEPMARCDRNWAPSPTESAPATAG